jgi:hypothetical protein
VDFTVLLSSMAPQLVSIIIWTHGNYTPLRVYLSRPPTSLSEIGGCNGRGRFVGFHGSPICFEYFFLLRLGPMKLTGTPITTLTTGGSSQFFLLLH